MSDRFVLTRRFFLCEIIDLAGFSCSQSGAR
nr:MAG TPA: hypothetical protein [Caudoviricetes sp.]